MKEPSFSTKTMLDLIQRTVDEEAYIDDKGNLSFNDSGERVTMTPEECRIEVATISGGVDYNYDQ